MSEINWSQEQQAVIDNIDTNTLVSASAGSGKTAVMIERLIRIISNGTPIARIIMVTFNNSVAQELRTKVANALKSKLESIEDSGSDEEKEYLRTQIEMVPMANISTLHSLCTNIIRENFEIVGIDPSFGIIDEESAALLFDNAVNEILREYQGSYNKDFEMLYKYLTRFAFKDIIKKLYNFIVAQPDRKEYLDNIIKYSTNQDLNTKPIIKKYTNLIREEAREWKAKYEDFAVLFKKYGFDFEKYVNKHMVPCVDILDELISATNIQELLKVVEGKKIPTVPSTRNEQDPDRIRIQNDYKEFNARVRETFKELQSFNDRTFEEHCNTVASTSRYIQLICDFVNKVIDTFNKSKLEENKLDFNDLEYYAVQILKNEEISNEYKEKYLYVCVDEYQDINAVQEFILNKISNGKNLFMVGDSKQSIYGFRQTDTNIFLNKLNRYKIDDTLGKAFYLNANYRSDKPVLDFVNEIFVEIMTEGFGEVDYKNDTQLVFGQTKYKTINKKPIQVGLFTEEKIEKEEVEYPQGWVYSIEKDNRSNEVKEFNKETIFVINKIKELVNNEQIYDVQLGESRPVKYNDIAILCSKRSDAKDILRAIDKYSIPADTSEMEIGETSLEVNIIIDVLKTIDNPRQDYALISAMTGFVGGFTMSELVEIRELCHEAVEKSIPERDDGKKRNVYFFEYVDEMANREGELADKVRIFVNKLERYRIIASFSKVNDLIKRIVNENNYNSVILMKKDGQQKLTQLNTYIGSLQDKYYNNCLEEFIKSADNPPVLKKINDGAITNANRIIMSTLHQSKGLEYPIVFYIGCTTSFSSGGGKASVNSKVLLDKDYGMCMQILDTDQLYFEDNLVYHAMSKYQKLQELKERMRLMYVGLTRARNMLFVTGVKKETKTEKHIVRAADAKNFMDWIKFAASRNEEIEEKYFIQENLVADEIEDYKRVDITFDKADDKQIEELNKALEIKYKYNDSKELNIKNTVTMINSVNYEEIAKYGDLNYYPEDEKVNKTLQGIAMHRALELIDFNVRDLFEVNEELDDMVRNDRMTIEEKELVKPEMILKCLKAPVFDIARRSKHYREKQFMLNVPGKFLYDDNQSEDRVLLQGVIDLLIETPEGYIIVDYKHSRKSDSLLIDSYSRQLNLYAQAVELSTNAPVLKKYIIVIDDGRMVEI